MDYRLPENRYTINNEFRVLNSCACLPVANLSSCSSGSFSFSCAMLPTCIILVRRTLYKIATSNNTTAINNEGTSAGEIYMFHTVSMVFLLNRTYLTTWLRIRTLPDLVSLVRCCLSYLFGQSQFIDCIYNRSRVLFIRGLFNSSTGDKGTMGSFIKV